AVIGLADEDIRAVCNTISEQSGAVVAPANYNAPGQVVISGQAQAVQDAGKLAKEKGAKLVKQLSVSVPSHCALMHDAGERLRSHLQETPLHLPKITVLHNIDTQARDDSNEIRNALIAQMEQSVQWAGTIQTMGERGCTAMFECGPGKVLTGL